AVDEAAVADGEGGVRLAGDLRLIEGGDGQGRLSDGEGRRVGRQGHGVVGAGAERAEGKGVGAHGAGGGGGRAQRPEQQSGAVAIDEAAGAVGQGRHGGAVDLRLAGGRRDGQRRRGDGEGGRVGGHDHGVVRPGGERAQREGVGADGAGRRRGRAQRPDQ